MGIGNACAHTHISPSLGLGVETCQAHVDSSPGGPTTGGLTMDCVRPVRCQGSLVTLIARYYAQWCTPAARMGKHDTPARESMP